MIENVDPLVKEKIDSLFRLEECSWKEYDRRRTYEWQINFSLWAGLAILIGFSVKEKFKLPCSPYLSIIVFSILALIYIYFQFGLFNSNRKDQGKRIHYIKQIHSLLDLPLPEGFNKKPWPSTKCIFTNWSHLSQILITMIFLSITCIVLAGKIDFMISIK